MSNVANIVQNGIADPVYLVDGNGNPISTTNPLGVNASFSASSISINDPTTTTNKATVDGSGNLHVAIGGPLAAGTNVIGHVIVDSAGNVSITSLPSLPAGSAVIGHVIVDSASSVSVSSLPALVAGSANIGGVELVDSAGTNKASINSSGQVQTEDIEQASYVSATSPPSATNAGSDTPYSFSSQVNRVIIQNNTSINVNCAFDAVASAGSLLLVPGTMLVYPKKCSILHLYTATAQNVNGSTAGNIVVLGAL